MKANSFYNMNIMDSLVFHVAKKLLDAKKSREKEKKNTERIIIRLP